MKIPQKDYRILLATIAGQIYAGWLVNRPTIKQDIPPGEAAVEMSKHLLTLSGLEEEEK